MTSESGKYPPWLLQKAPDPHLLEKMKGLLDALSLHTVCEAAQCPNQGRCFSDGTATFLIMGELCTRSCRFCAVEKGRPLPLDPLEPENVARAVGVLSLKHVVITSVTRDDLSDGGASHFARTIEAIRLGHPDAVIEVLVPDFQGSLDALRTVADSGADVIGHNIETVPSLYHRLRPEADYHRSLRLLETAKSMSNDIVTKSGLMLGLDEGRDEVLGVMQELLNADCDCLTIGQYLPPSPKHYPLSRYVGPAEFEELRETGVRMGFKAVFSAPLVRSSFMAQHTYREALRKESKWRYQA